MRKHLSYFGVLAAAAPLAVSAPPHHATEVRFAAGSGSYAVITRGCDNSVISKQSVAFDNVAAEVSHKFPAPVRLGARAGAFRVGGRDPTRYVNPYISFDWPAFSLGGGWVGADDFLPDGSDDDLADDPFDQQKSTGSGHVRIGSSKFYFSASYFEGLPLLTPGYATAGFGSGRERVHVWVGACVLPYDTPGILANAEVSVGRRLGLTGTGRLGSAEGEFEGAFALGVRFRWGSRSGEPSEPSGGAPDSTAPP